MSQPPDPYRGPRDPYRRDHGEQPRGGQPEYRGQPYESPQHGGQQYGQPQHGGQQYGSPQYGRQSYGEPEPYGGQQPYGRRPYDEPRYDEPAQYGGSGPYGAPPPEMPPARPPAARRRAPAAPRRAPAARGPRRLPGLGLLLTLAGLVVQVVSLFVLPWVRLGGTDPRLWQLTANHDAQSLGDWYLVLLSYPVAALSIVLALASVLQSVAVKMIWGGLTLVGLGVLAVRYGIGPLAGQGADLSTRDIVIATAAVAALVVVLFMLRMAVSTFRMVAGLILLGITGVHVAAILDLANNPGADHLNLGAYGPALGYLLTAIAAFRGPR